MDIKRTESVLCVRDRGFVSYYYYIVCTDNVCTLNRVHISSSHIHTHTENTDRPSVRPVCPSSFARKCDSRSIEQVIIIVHTACRAHSKVRFRIWWIFQCFRMLYMPMHDNRTTRFLVNFSDRATPNVNRPQATMRDRVVSLYIYIDVIPSSIILYIYIDMVSLSLRLRVDFVFCWAKATTWGRSKNDRLLVSQT